MDTLKKFTGSSLFLPVVALVVLLVFNTLFVDGFLSVQLTEDGRLRLPIDILNRSFHGDNPGLWHDLSLRPAVSISRLVRS